MVTIYDIAKKAAVSPATVSLVIHEDPRVNLVTRKRIEEIIKKTGYRRRKISHKSKRTVLGDILIYCPFDFTTSSRPSVLDLYAKEMSRAIREKGGNPITVIGGESKSMLSYFLKKREMEGVIIFGIESSDPFFQFEFDELMKGAKVPTVIVGDHPTYGQYDYVSIHNFKAGKRVADYFISRKHQKVGIVHLDCHRSWDQERLRGFYDRVVEVQKSEPSVFLYRPGMSELELEKLAKSIRSSKITGLFASNNWLDVDCAVALEKQGVKIGRNLDLEMVGFSSEAIPLKDRTLYLDYIQYSVEDLIESALNLIVSRRNGEEKSECVGKLLPTQLILREE